MHSDPAAHQMYSTNTRSAIILDSEIDQLTLVAFDVNDRLRPVGKMQLLAETIDRGELEFYYIDTLAHECDQFEYFSTGHDQYYFDTIAYLTENENISPRIPTYDVAGYLMDKTGIKGNMNR